MWKKISEHKSHHSTLVRSRCCQYNSHVTSASFHASSTIVFHKQRRISRKRDSINFAQQQHRKNVKRLWSSDKAYKVQVKLTYWKTGKFTEKYHFLFMELNWKCWIWKAFLKTFTIMNVQPVLYWCPVKICRITWADLRQRYSLFCCERNQRRESTLFPCGNST